MKYATSVLSIQLRALYHRARFWIILLSECFISPLVVPVHAGCSAVESSGHTRSPSVSAAQRQGTVLIIPQPRKHSIQSQIVYSLSSYFMFVLIFQGTVSNTASCVQLHKRAERVAVALMERGRLNTGDHVALVYPPGKMLILLWSNKGCSDLRFCGAQYLSVFLLCRYWSDRHFLWLSVLRLCSGHCQASPPTELNHNPANR